MANFDFSTSSWNTNLRMLEPTDSNANSNFNNIYQQIITNQVYLYNLLTNINVRSVRDQMKTAGLVKTIEVAGSANTYYPVSIKMGGTENYRVVRFGLGKHLSSKTATYPNNHSTTNTSSCSYEWLISAGGWDGNERFVRTIFGCYNYAPLLSHFEMQGGSYPGIVMWLRGGGTAYVLSCDDPFEVTISYSRTNITSYADDHQYAYFVSPRTDIGNGGNYKAGDLQIDNI